jgi:hypothetical protein
MTVLSFDDKAGIDALAGMDEQPNFNGIYKLPANSSLAGFHPSTPPRGGLNSRPLAFYGSEIGIGQKNTNQCACAGGTLPCGRLAHLEFSKATAIADAKGSTEESKVKAVADKTALLPPRCSAYPRGVRGQPLQVLELRQGDGGRNQ